ncbi:MAG: sulfurtransferase TusA family protein [Azospirillaceae bacterium]
MAGGEDRLLDVRGMKCPMPVLRTRRELAAMRSGDILQVLATDPKAPDDIAAFCQETGQEVLSSGEADGEFRLRLRRR